MKFNRRLKPFRCLSFDLDDTLYENHGVIRLAEQALLDHLNDTLNVKTSVEFWRGFKRQVYKKKPELKHDVTAWRQASLTAGLNSLGIDDVRADSIIENALAVFLKARSQICVPQSNLAFLKKARESYTVIAITNGNVDAKQANLTQHFDAMFFAGKGNKQKPDPQLFQLASAQLNFPCTEILHIGDSMAADVQGALRAGCQSVWLNEKNKINRHAFLPDVEIATLTALSALL